jgi:hypothetical protein
VWIKFEALCYDYFFKICSYLNIQKGKVKLEELQFQHEVTLPPDCFYSYRLLMPKFDTLSLEVEVLEGGEIDLLITNEYNFVRYVKCEPFIYVVSGSILNIKKIKNLFIAQDDGIYHIILDNTYYPENGARPNKEINGGNVKVRISAKSHQLIQNDIERPFLLWH